MSEVPLILQSPNTETGTGFLWMAPAVSSGAKSRTLITEMAQCSKESENSIPSLQ